MSDQEPKSPVDKPNSTSESGTLRSPVRPRRPQTSEFSSEVPRLAPAPPENTIEQTVDMAAATSTPENAHAALDALRQKMEHVANEFSTGKINRAQFNAIYGRYSEQREIIERLIQRNPDNEAWKHAAAPGHTSFLRSHFEARLLFYLVYQHNVASPLTMGGKTQPNMEQISPVLKSLWGMKERPKVGLARKQMSDGQWMVLALGEFALTMAVYMLEPSMTQIALVRDLHADFERANRTALEHGTRSLDRFVFPQRSLAEKKL